MKNHNKITRGKIWIIWFLSGVYYFFAGIGFISDVFGFYEGISTHKEGILKIFHDAIYLSTKYWEVFLYVALFFTVSSFIFKTIQIRKEKAWKANTLSWFDPTQRNTVFQDYNNYTDRLKGFFSPSNKYFSWWAVTGVAGMGKSRLVLEVLKEKKYNNKVIYLKSPNDYEKSNLIELVDSILKSHNLRNIIIAEDAQIYMDNISIFIEEISNKDYEEVGDHIIRLLLLIRTGEDGNVEERYNQLNSIISVEEFRYYDGDKALHIHSYEDDQIVQITESYIQNTLPYKKKHKMGKEEIHQIALTVLSVIKSNKIDPIHKRPLFALFIADTLLDEKDPTYWDKIKILDYVVEKREDTLLRNELRDILVNYNQNVFEKVKIILCLSVITDGFSVGSLGRIASEINDDLRTSGAKVGNVEELLVALQKIDCNNNIRANMPDLLSEYYLLKNLVLDPTPKNFIWICEKIWQNFDNAVIARQKVEQDFNYLYSSNEKKIKLFYRKLLGTANTTYLSLIIETLKTLREGFEESNGYVIIIDECYNYLMHNHEITIAKEFAKVLFNLSYFCSVFAPDQTRSLKYINRIIKLSKNYDNNLEIIVEYSKGLLLLEQTAPEIDGENGKISYIHELGKISENNKSCKEILIIYCQGLCNLSCHVPEIEGERGKRKYVEELKRISDSHNENDEIAFNYCMSLCNLLKSVQNIKGDGGKLACVTKMKEISDSFRRNKDIALEYCMGLFHIISAIHTKEDAHIMHECVAKMQIINNNFKGDEKIAFEYSKGIVNVLLSLDTVEGELGSRAYTEKLRNLYKEHKNNKDIAVSYCKGLYNLMLDLPNIYGSGGKKECLDELKRMNRLFNGEKEIATEYCRALYNFAIYDEKHFDYYVSELAQFIANEEVMNYIKIQLPLAYFFMINNISEQSDSDKYADIVFEYSLKNEQS